jgi:hypothetical protein
MRHQHETWRAIYASGYNASQMTKSRTASEMQFGRSLAVFPAEFSVRIDSPLLI